MAKTTLKEKIIGNALVIGITELIMMLGGMKLMKLAFDPILRAIEVEDATLTAFLCDAISLAAFIIPTAVCIIYMLVTNRRSLRVFAEGGFKKSVAALLIGLLFGFGVNAVVSLLTGLTGTVRFSYSGFMWYMPLMFPAVFIQCACEEVLLRGYVARYAEKRHDWSSVAFMSGTLFIFHHVSNLAYYGFDPVFVINVFLFGVMLYLLVRVKENFWICVGFHAAWNFTQEQLFGLPNSGKGSPIALFTGTEVKDNFFYNTVYGNEGSLCTTVFVSVIILFLVWRLHKAGKTYPTSKKVKPYA